MERALSRAVMRGTPNLIRRHSTCASGFNAASGSRSRYLLHSSLVHMSLVECVCVCAFVYLMCVREQAMHVSVHTCHTRCVCGS